MGRYRLSPAAQTDLLEIRIYTKTTWGEAQARKYLSELRSGLEKLADAPLIGKAREEIAQGLHSFSLARHIAFYREYFDGIEVVRVLHASMDVERQFEIRNNNSLDS
jgi:toxin ParE1/3/4